MKSILEREEIGFAQIKNEILQDSDLSLDALGLYCYMFSLPNDWHFSFERLAKCRKVGLRTIRRCIAELENKGLLTRTTSYNVAYGCITTYRLYHTPRKNDNATFQNETFQNERSQNEMSQNVRTLKTNNNTNKIELKTNKDIYSEPAILKAKSEKPKKEPPFDFMTYAAEKWDKAESKLCKREEWLDFMAAKNIALKAKRKSITQKMVDLNFNELYKLNEIGENVSARLEKATAEGWQGIWFDRDSREWNKRGACFKSNVTSDTIDYGATPTDSRIAKITTTYKLN